MTSITGGTTLTQWFQLKGEGSRQAYRVNQSEVVSISAHGMRKTLLHWW